MILAETRPVDWILPLLLLLGWIALWVVRRRVPPWFFAVAAMLAVLCVLAGMLAGRVEIRGTDCTPDNLCFSENEVDWWANGLLGLLTTGALGLATLVVTAAVRAGRRWVPVMSHRRSR